MSLVLSDIHTFCHMSLFLSLFRLSSTLSCLSCPLSYDTLFWLSSVFQHLSSLTFRSLSCLSSTLSYDSCHLSTGSHQLAETYLCCCLRYLINFAPFDVVYKFTKLLPVRLMIFCMKEIQRTNKIHHAILYGLKHLAGAYVQIIIYAIAKGLSLLTQITL